MCICAFGVTPVHAQSSKECIGTVAFRYTLVVRRNFLIGSQRVVKATVREADL